MYRRKFVLHEAFLKADIHRAIEKTNKVVGIELVLKYTPPLYL